MTLKPTLSRNHVSELIEKRSRRVFKESDLKELLFELQTERNVATGVKLHDLVEFLLSETSFRRVPLAAGPYPGVVRYVWIEASPYELGMSLRPGAYLTHATAAFLHGLTEHVTRTVYCNKEQTPKGPPDSSLTQDALNRAFSREQRSSRYIFKAEGWEYVLLSGKYTGGLEIGSVEDVHGVPIPVTKLERTLIDLVVRPAYAGGVLQVLECFREARGSVSTRVLLRTLKLLEYLYPYHQALGFYMEHAGFDERSLASLRDLGLNYDFYLAHGMAEKRYDESWRLFVPKGL